MKKLFLLFLLFPYLVMASPVDQTTAGKELTPDIQTR